MKEKLHFRRFEFKYPLHKSLADLMIPELLNYMVFDSFASKDGSYEVLSLYLDSEKFKAYHEKLDGLKNRQKLRFRTYRDIFDFDSKIFCEVKKKQGPVVIKDRTVIDYVSMKKLLEGDLNFDLNNQDFLYEMLKFNMSPSLLVQYKRLPLFAKSDQSFRVTLDYDLKFKPLRLKNSEMKSFFENTLVLEVKFNGSMPAWFADLIRKYNLRQDSFSKYCSGIEACYGVPNSF